MNKDLQEYARETIKDGLSKCTNSTKMMFKRMYSGGNLDKGISDVVDAMPEEKLDTAMQQIKRTLGKRQLNK